MTALPAPLLREAAAREGRRLVDVAAADLAAPVPRCHGWDTTALLDHVASVLRFVTAVVVPRAKPTGRPEPRPEGTDPLRNADEALDGLLTALDGLDPDEPVWNWSATSPDTGAFWLRRMPQELLVHRVDAERAVGEPTPVDPELAADGVDELLAVFLPRVQGRTPFVHLQGTVLLERTDGPGAWHLALTPDTCTVSASGPADVTVRGPAEGLLLAAWGRDDWDRLDVTGDADLLRAWAQEVRP